MSHRTLLDRAALALVWFALGVFVIGLATAINWAVDALRSTINY